MGKRKTIKKLEKQLINSANRYRDLEILISVYESAIQDLQNKLKIDETAKILLGEYDE